MKKGERISQYEYQINISTVGIMINCMIKIAQNMINGLIEQPKPPERCIANDCRKCPVAQQADNKILLSEEMKKLNTAQYILS